MSLDVKYYPLGPLGENTYLVTDTQTGQQAIIDPGYYGPEVASEITDLRYVLLTHGHYDHYASAGIYLETYPGVTFAAPSGETYLLHGGRDNKWMAISHGGATCPEAQLLLSEGDTVILGETVFRVIETPGHTEGGICYLTDNIVFTGDTLFRLSVGNTSLETGDWPTMVKSIQEKLYTLDDDTIVYPGHGPATQIGYEKRSNPFV